MAQGDRCFIVVGAGQAGAWIARTLRSEGFDGRIVLIGSERHPPYERPPLSKSAIVEEDFQSPASLLDEPRAAQTDVEMWLGTEVVRIDRSSQAVHCADGRSIGYDRLFLTTGSDPRRPDWLPAERGARVHTLRTRDDAFKLRVGLRQAKSLLIVGGGWIGLEVAASARSLGVEVAIFEAGDRVCARSLPAELSAWFEELHRSNGVTLSTNARIVGVEEQPDRVLLQLADGSRVEGDQLLVGIGNVPATALAEAAGLSVANGIVVDAAGRTSDPHIYAAGDVTSLPCTLTGGQTRRESFANAQNQSVVAAKASLGHEVVYDELPWLWSDQYGANIQMLGLPERACRLVARPAKRGRAWLALDEEGRAIGAVAVDAPREVRAARKLILGGLPVADEEWADEAARNS